MELGSSAPNAKKKIGGISQHSTNRSQHEGVDTCQDRVLNALGRGYYGKAKVDRTAKATPGTQVPLTRKQVVP